MKIMENKKDNPGVYIPPPIIYVLTFLTAVFIQKKAPIDNLFFNQRLTKYIGLGFLIIASFFAVRSLRQFFLSKNSLVTIKPALSLQTNGIYRIPGIPCMLV